MYGPEIRQSDLCRLASILESAQSDRPWKPNELGDVLKHQLKAPLEFQVDSSVCLNEKGETLISVGELLRSPRPRLDLLENLKAFAKHHIVDAQEVIPQEIAALLYYAAISAAFLRCSSRITDLDPEAIRLGLTRLLQCNWLDDMTRQLLGEAMARLPRPSLAPNVTG